MTFFLQNGSFLCVMVSSLACTFYNKCKWAYFLKKYDQFQWCYKYLQLKRNHIDFSKSIIFVEKCDLSEIVPGVQNLLYGAISEILLGKRPGLEGEQNLAVWRTGIADGKLFLMLVPFLCRSLLKRDIVMFLLGSNTSVVISICGLDVFWFKFWTFKILSFFCETFALVL